MKTSASNDLSSKQARTAHLDTLLRFLPLERLDELSRQYDDDENIENKVKDASRMGDVEQNLLLRLIEGEKRHFETDGCSLT